MQKRDGIRLLPKRIIETLVRAFAALPPVRFDVLILQHVTEARPVMGQTDDYNVVWSTRSTSSASPPHSKRVGREDRLR